MKKINIVFLTIVFASVTFILSCSDNNSQSNDKYNQYFQKGPDECNQDEYEDEEQEVSIEVEEECVERQVPYVPARREVLYSIRDSILSKYPKGNKYINEYYETSKIEKDYKKFTIGNFVDVIELMPYIYDAHDKFNDVSYNGVIISSSLKIKLVNVLNAYKKLSNDITYNSIINSFINDVNALAGKDKSDVIYFMEN